jgi:hypothetical protein
MPVASNITLSLVMKKRQHSSRQMALVGQNLLASSILTLYGIPSSIRCITGSLSYQFYGNPSHALLGMAKLQWYSMFIKWKALRASTATRPRELDILHKSIETVSSYTFYLHSLRDPFTDPGGNRSGVSGVRWCQPRSLS